MKAKRILVAILALFLLLVVAGALANSLPLYLIGAGGAILTYLVACVCTDVNEFGR